MFTSVCIDGTAAVQHVAFENVAPWPANIPTLTPLPQFWQRDVGRHVYTASDPFDIGYLREIYEHSLRQGQATVYATLAPA